MARTRTRAGQTMHRINVQVRRIQRPVRDTNGAYLGSQESQVYVGTCACGGYTSTLYLVPGQAEACAQDHVQAKNDPQAGIARRWRR